METPPRGQMAEEGNWYFFPNLLNVPEQFTTPLCLSFPQISELQAPAATETSGALVKGSSFGDL